MPASSAPQPLAPEDVSELVDAKSRGQARLSMLRCLQVLPAENSLTLANKYPRLVNMCEDLAGGWLPACCCSAQ